MYPLFQGANKGCASPEMENKLEWKAWSPRTEGSNTEAGRRPGKQEGAGLWGEGAGSCHQSDCGWVENRLERTLRSLGGWGSCKEKSMKNKSVTAKKNKSYAEKQKNIHSTWWSSGQDIYCCKSHNNLNPDDWFNQKCVEQLWKRWGKGRGNVAELRSNLLNRASVVNI